MEDPKWFTDGACDILGGTEKTGFIQCGEEEVKGTLAVCNGINQCMQMKDPESSQMCTMTVQRPQIQVKTWEILVKYRENYLLLGDSNTGAF